MSVPLIGGVFLTLWLLWEAWWDYHDQNLPIWFSLVPLAAGLIWRAISGDWGAALFAALLVASTHFAQPIWRIGSLGVLAGLAAANLPPSWLPFIAGCVLAELLFELGAMGGADALAVIYALLWFPSWTALAALLAGMLLLSVIELIVRYRGRVLRQFAGALTGKRQPTEAAGMGGLAAGFAVFTLTQLIHLAG